MNSDNRRQYILAAVLLIVIGYYLIDSGVIKLGSEPIETKQTDLQAAVVPVAIQPIIPDMTRLEKLVNEDWQLGISKDPFYYVTADLKEGDGLLFGKAATSSVLKLTGISCIGNGCTAIVNSSVVHEGDVISGYKVEKIELMYVVLKKGENTIRLILNE